VSDPRIGQRCRVTAEDCCIQTIRFTATVIAVMRDYDDHSNDEPLDDDSAGFTFDNGVVIEEGWHGGIALDWADDE
jgi:hypothetical protein